MLAHSQSTPAYVGFQATKKIQVVDWHRNHGLQYFAEQTDLKCLVDSGFTTDLKHRKSKSGLSELVGAASLLVVSNYRFVLCERFRSRSRKDLFKRL